MRKSSGNSFLHKIGKDALQDIVNQSNSYADVLRRLGMSTHGANRKTLFKVFEEFDIDLTALRNNKSASSFGGIEGYSLESILNGEHPEYQGRRLLQRLINDGYKQRKCERCGLTEWCGEPIPLQLHHKDGDHNNNHLDNLEALCPNCHALTDSYRGKNSKKRKIIPMSLIETKQEIKIYGISEDGTRLYDGYGNYKILCPICKKKYISPDQTRCKSCLKKDIKKYSDSDWKNI